MIKQVATIEGMKCSGCADNVKNKFSALEQVNGIDVNLEKHTALIEANNILSLKELNAALEGTAYEVKNIKEA